MPFAEEFEAMTRALRAAGEAYPDRLASMEPQIRKWFTFAWQGVPPPATKNRCRLCAHMAHRILAEWTESGPSMRVAPSASSTPPKVPPKVRGRTPPPAASPEEESLPTLIGLCPDCAEEGVRIATDPRYPVRDMVRIDAIRALRAAGDEETIAVVDEMASGYPDLRRDTGRCELCRAEGPRISGAATSLCGACLEAVRLYALRAIARSG